jgi:hypothetical protein
MADMLARPQRFETMPPEVEPIRRYIEARAG